jgi:hypothetical protein
MSTIKVTNIKATGETASRAVSGVAAVWCNFDADAPNIRDSINTSSVTDGGNCNYTYNFSSNMGNANYVPAGYIKDGASNNYSRVLASIDADTYSTSALQVRPSAVNSGTLTTAFDPDYVCVMIMGDLA